MAWAKPLARGLAARWEFLKRFLDDADDGRREPRAAARERGLRETMIAATLSTKFGPHWSAGDIVHLVENYGLSGPYAQRRTVIAAGDAHSPLSYLAEVTHRALRNPHALVPHHSPVREAYERDVLAVELAAERATDAARHAQLRAQWDERDTAAAAERTGPRIARTAALETARAAANRCAAARQARGGPAPAEDGLGDWPQIAQPGFGRPAGPA